MHVAVVPIGPLARRLAFGAVDSVLYSGQLYNKDYAKCEAHSVYLRDKSEIRVYGTSASAVAARAQELRVRLDDSIEYIAGVVYAKDAAIRQERPRPAEEEWRAAR